LLDKLPSRVILFLTVILLFHFYNSPFRCIQDSLGDLFGKLDGHLHRTRHVEHFCASIDFSNRDDAWRRYRFTILPVVDGYIRPRDQ
jgi:hypothetical protein